MAPLFTIEVPNPAQEAEAVKFYNKIADKTLEKLGIPDPDDKEVAVVHTDGKPNVIISFTKGADEYGVGEIFDPPKELIDSVAQELSNTESPLGITEIKMEPYKNSAFLIRELEREEPIAPISEEELKTIGKNIESIKTKIVLSPDKEEFLISQNGNGLEINNSIIKTISETLGLPEDISVQNDEITAIYADTDLSSEIDLRTKDGSVVNPEIMEYLAQKIEQLLNQNPNTKDGSAEIWVRQGISKE